MKMKNIKFLVLTLLAAMVAVTALSFGSIAFAETDTKTVQDIMLEQFSEEEREVLTNKDYYEDWFEEEVGAKVEDFNYSSAPVFKVYNGYPWSKADRHLDEIFDYYKNDKYSEYLVFDEDVLRLRGNLSGEDKGVTLYHIYREGYEIPMYVKDLAENNFPLDLSKVARIYCFEEPAGQGILYFVGEQTNVVYYGGFNTSRQVFTFEEFAEKGIEFYNYFSSYEHNHDKDGNPLVFGYPSFSDYLVNGPIVRPDFDTPVYKNPFLWIGIAAGVCAICAVSVVIVKKSRGKNN